MKTDKQFLQAPQRLDLRDEPNGRPVALVTGAAGIIGPTIIARLQSRGWRVAASDRDEASFKLHQKIFGKPIQAERCLLADLSHQESCEDLVQRVEAGLGPISAIVNNATINLAVPLGEIREEDVHRTFGVNFLAPLWLIQAAMGSLIRKHGSVVNVSSVMVQDLHRKNFLYACSKAALEKATEMFSVELSEQGVRFNTVRVGRIPGFAFAKDHMTALPDTLAQRMVSELLPHRLESMRNVMGENAVGTPRDVAAAVDFLLSPDASFINGQTLVVNGGYQYDPSKAAEAEALSQRLVSEWLKRNVVAADGIPCP